MNRKIVWCHWISIALFLLSHVWKAEGSAILEIKLCVPKWFEGMPLNLKCFYKSGNIDKRVYFIKNGAPVVQCNSTFGSCFNYQPGYEVIGSSSGSMTVMIQSFNGSDDVTEWECMDASPPNPPASCIINSTISAKYEIKQNQLESLTNVSLPFSVSVTGNCIYLLPTCTWKYKISNGTENNVPDTLTKITSNNDTCNSTDEESKCTLSFDQIPSEFAGHKINIILEIDHPSLKPAEQLRIVSPELTIPGTTPPITAVCVCDCTVALCVLQAVWMVVVVVYLILCLTVLKDFKPRWIVLVVFGFIQIVLGLISVGCLSIEHTCSSCKSDAYVAGAVFCALSLLCGTVVVIVVLLLKVIRKPSSGTLNVASEGKKRPPPEGQAETVMIKDEKKSPQSVPPTATTTVNSSRQLPPDSGNVSGDEGKKPRPLPAPSGNVSPTVTSASQIDTDVNNETQDDVMRTPGRLPPLEMTETETEKPKKKKKKKKSKKAEDHREKREDSEEGNDDNQREEKSKESDATEYQNL